MSQCASCLALGVMTCFNFFPWAFGGVTNDSNLEIRLGTSTALSGPAAELGQSMNEGMRVGLERCNRAGGIRGRSLRLVCLDDGYEPTRTAPNMRALLEREKVLAVMGNVGTPTGVTAMPIATEQKTLFFAPYSGAGIFRKNPPDHYVINYRASYAEEIEKVVTTLIRDGGFRATDIALFTQRDAYGDAGFAGGVAALKQNGLQNERDILHVRYERNTLAVEDALASLLYAAHPPRAVIMVGAYAPCAKFIRLAHEARLAAIFHNVSFVGSSSLATELGCLPANVLITQVVPHPADTNVPLVAEYQADLAASGRGVPPGFGSLEGYVAARLLVRAMSNIRGPLTREALVQSLEKLGTFDLGLGEELRLGPEEHQACHRVWLTRLQDGKVVPFDWTSLAALARRLPPP